MANGDFERQPDFDQFLDIDQSIFVADWLIQREVIDSRGRELLFPKVAQKIEVDLAADFQKQFGKPLSTGVRYEGRQYAIQRQLMQSEAQTATQGLIDRIKSGLRRHTRDR